MKPHRLGSRFLSAALASLVLPCTSSAEDLTIDWILDPENTRALAPPRTMWLADETLLIDDGSKSEAERHLERLDPRTMERKPACDRAKVLESWKALVGEDNAPQRVPLPSAAAPDSRTLLHERSGDLFVLDLETSSVRRLTNTEAAEDAVQLAPDGRSVAFVRDNDLYSIETATGRERRLTRDGTPDRLNGTLSWVYWEEIMDRRDRGYVWSPDSSAILYLQTDESHVTRYPLVDHEPAVPSVRWQRYPKAGTANPRARAGIVELSGGDTRWIEWEGSPPAQDVEYIARLGWIPSSKAALVQTLNRAQNRLIVWIAERSGGPARPVFEETSKTWIDLHDDLHVLPDGERALWLSERSGFRHLYVQALRGGPAAPVTSGEWMLRAVGGSAHFRGAVAWIDSSASSILFHAASPAPMETQLYRVKLDGQELRRISEGDGSHACTVSPGGRYFVDEHSRSGVPPRLTLHRADGTLLHVLHASSSEKLAPFGLAPPQLFTVPADDGSPLPARLFRPQPVEEGRKYPAIVYIYGGPGAPAVSDRWDGTWLLWSQLLAQRGFAVFTVDPRSASDQSKPKKDLVHRKFYGDGELKDILAGVRHLRSLPFIDPDRIGIWGWSGGGTNTCHAMTRSKEFRAGIAVAGVADQRYYDTIYTERYMGTPEENKEGYDATAAAGKAADLHGRLLIVHGAADDNVHPQNAMRFVHELVSAGKQFDLMIYPRRDHGIGDPKARKHLFQLMLDFWERNLRNAQAQGGAAEPAVPASGAKESTGPAKGL